MINKPATAAAIILLAGGTWSGPVAAEQPDPIVIEIDQRFVTGQTETVHIAQPLEPGTYVVEVDTSDSYQGRTGTAPESQTSERVTVLGGTTDDLEDGVEGATGRTKFTVELPEGVDGFTVDHAGTGYDWDSVNVDVITITPIASETPVQPAPEPAAPVEVPTPPATVPEPAQPQPAPLPLPEAPPAVPTPAQPKYTG